MEGFVVADDEFRVLRVEGLDVGIGNLAVGNVLLVVMLRCEDRHLYALALLREKVERSRRRPVVDENQRPLRASDQLQHQRPRIPQLPVVEHALYRRNLRLHEEIDLLLKGGDAVIVPCKITMHRIFQLVQSGIDRISAKEVFLEHLGRPDAELCCTSGIHSIANCNNDI